MNHRDPCGERIGGLAKRRNGITATSKIRGAVARYGGMMRKLSSSYSVPRGSCEASAKSWGRQPDTGPLVGRHMSAPLVQVHGPLGSLEGTIPPGGSYLRWRSQWT